MAINSRDKGARAELKARDYLRSKTGYKWERVPGSGALDVSHKLKGDLYIPETPNRFCIEVKHYKDDQINTKLLTGKSPTCVDWWKQCVRQAEQVDKEPLLIFKHDRSKWFAAVTIDFMSSMYENSFNIIEVPYYGFSIILLDDFLNAIPKTFFEET